MDAAAQGRSARRRAFWLLARHERGRFEVLAAEIAGRGRALPVFSFAEGAAFFARFGGVSGGGWRTDAEELATVLLGPCRDVERVALDPLPEIGAGPLNRLASVGCGRFVRFLLEGDNGASGVTDASGPRLGSRVVDRRQLVRSRRRGKR